MKLSIISLFFLPLVQKVLSHSNYFRVVGVLDPEIDEIKQAALTLSESLAAPADDPHPFWVFEWDLLFSRQVLECSIVLFLAGMLCSAGGIGGGGIYVSVLMVVGWLTPRDAVPLSKAIVFAGSLSSLALNLGRTLTGKAGDSRTIINYNICRLVVPAALIGTLFGVVINRNTADTVIVAILSTILLGVTASVIKKTCDQHKEETAEAAGQDGGDRTPEASSVQLHVTPACEAAPEVPWPRGAMDAYIREKNQLQHLDACLALGMLTIVVVSGVVRHHASACLWELQNHGSQERRQAACQHPTLSFMVGNRLEDWMSDPSGASWAMILTLTLPISTCLIIMAFNSRNAVIHEGWSPYEVAKYELMGVLTGCLAGLVGIGGGLIFSPFFLFMGVEPVIAVATSSTCVIFTSSSTTLQYLFTDRIITSLTVVYGLVNLMASYLGTAFVHFLQDRFATRRSYISAIVAVGVLISAILSLTKLTSHLAAQAQAAPLH